MDNSVLTMMNNDYDPPRISEKQCERCHSFCENGLGWCIRREKDQFGNYRSEDIFYVHHRNTYILQRKAAEGCRLCQMICDKFKTECIGLEGEGDGWRVPACLNRAAEGEPDDFGDESANELERVVKAFEKGEEGDEARVILELKPFEVSTLRTVQCWMEPVLHYFEINKGRKNTRQFRGNPIYFPTDIGPSFERLTLISLLYD